MPIIEEPIPKEILDIEKDFLQAIAVMVAKKRTHWEKKEFILNVNSAIITTVSHLLYTSQQMGMELFKLFEKKELEKYDQRKN